MRKFVITFVAGLLLMAPTISQAGHRFKPPETLDLHIQGGLSDGGHIDIRSNIKLRVMRSFRRAMGPDLIWLNPRGGTEVNPSTVFLMEDISRARFVVNPNCNERALAVYRVTDDGQASFFKNVNRHFEFDVPNRENGAVQHYIVAIWCEGCSDDNPSLLEVYVESSASRVLDRHRGYR